MTGKVREGRSIILHEHESVGQLVQGRAGNGRKVREGRSIILHESVGQLVQGGAGNGRSCAGREEIIKKGQYSDRGA